MLNPRVRFAPSPTGPLHIGGVRTALFNYLFAKKYNGDFILRIEDTDQTRFVPGAEEYIVESLAWCGIEFNEGVSCGGPHAPYRQSERKEIYVEYIQKLIDSGNAYYAFDTPEELDAIRKKYESEGKTFQYDSFTRGTLKNSLALGAETTKNLIDSGIPYVVRFKVSPDETIEADDLIRGKVRVNSSVVDDKVLFKSDGLPTYHLANIVDDHLMEITHVIRGEEWLPSLPLHIMLYKAFGWEDTMPQFAHLPLILKPTGKGKLSKRDGDALGFPVFPLEWKNSDDEIFSGYREWGYLPEAFVNMLALLGWNPGTEQEKFSVEELIKEFSFDKINKSGARFDPEKTKWFNHQYIKNISDEQLAQKLNEELDKRDIHAEESMLIHVCKLIKERLSLLSELWDHSYYFFEIPYDYDEKVVAKHWKENIAEEIEKIKQILIETNPFSSAETEKNVKEYIASTNLNMGQILNVLRLLIVGKSFGVHLFDIMEVLGKEETIKRVEKGAKSISDFGRRISE